MHQTGSNRPPVPDAVRKKAAAILEEKKRRQGARDQRKKRGLIIGLSALAVLITAAVLYFIVLDEYVTYRRAVALYDKAQYAEAEALFRSLGDYRDSDLKKTESVHARGLQEMAAGDLEAARRTFIYNSYYPPSNEMIPQVNLAIAEKHIAARAYVQAIRYMENAADAARLQALLDEAYLYAVDRYEAGDPLAALCIFVETVPLHDSRSYIRAAAQALTGMIAVGEEYIYLLQADGSVVLEILNGGETKAASAWRGMTAVAGLKRHVLGLKTDGTVMAAGSNADGRCDVSGWKHIVGIAAGDEHSVGLRADGTVVAAGSNREGQCDVSGWTDIVMVAAGAFHTIGLRADGTVVAAGDNGYGQCAVNDWTKVAYIAAAGDNTVAIRTDGTVFAAGDSLHGKCEVDGVTHAVTASISETNIVFLLDDGTVLVTGDNHNAQTQTSSYTRAIAGLALPDRKTLVLSNLFVPRLVSQADDFGSLDFWSGLGKHSG